MAKFTRDVPSVSPSSFISKPAVEAARDESTATLIGGAETLVKQGIDAFGRAKAKELTSEVNATVNEFLESQKASEEAQGQFTDLAVQSAFIKEQTASDPEEADFFQDPAIKEAESRMNDLALAAQQGAISTSTLKLRVESLTRSYINRYPGFGEELRTVAARTVGDYKQTIGVIATQEKTQRAIAVNARKQMDAYKLKHNILPGDPMGNRKIAIIAQKETEAAEAVAASKILKFNQAEANQAFIDNLPAASTTIWFNTQAEMNQIEGSGASDSQKAQQLVELKASLDARVTQTYSGIQGFNEEMKQRLVGSTMSYIDARIDFQKHGGEAETLANQRTSLENSALNGLLDKPEFARATALMGIFRGDLSAIYARSPELGNKILDIYEGALNTGTVPPSKKGYKESIEVSKGVIQNLADLDETGDRPETKDMQEIIRAYTNEVKRRGWSNTQYDGVVELFNDPSVIKVMKSMPDIESIQGDVISRFQQNLFQKFIPNLSATLAQRMEFPLPFKGGESIRLDDIVTLQEAPNNTVKYLYTGPGNPSGEVSSAIRLLNDTYTSRLNKLTRAWAHANGSTDYKASLNQILSMLDRDTASQDVVTLDMLPK